MLFCGLGGNPGNCGVSVSPKLFAPRLGLAYRPAEGFVARAGFSLNWQQENMYRAALRTYPAEIDSSLSPANSYGSVGNISDGLTVISPVDVRSGSISLPAGIGFSTLPLNYIRGYVMSWNASLQKALSHDFTAQVSYVGNRVNHQVTVQNQNFGQVGGGGASQPFFAQGITAAVNLYLPMTTTNYHSMQATLSRRLANGISVNAAYTFSKAISSFAGLIPIPQYFKLNKGLQATDTPHKFTLSAVTEAPFGKGKRFLSNGGIPAAILGGWQANWLVAAYSGAPFTVSAATASLNAPGSTQQADLVKPSVAIPGKVGPSSAYFDPLAFAPVTQARFGTAGFNILRGPRTVDLDTSLFRYFALTERFRLQFRVEAFNITNTPHFGIPSGLSVSSLQLNTDGSIKNLNGFGVITSTNNSSRDYDERYFRMGLRLSF
jgi:hypothetical protein